jgi:Ca-activated chloride channel homolog
MKRHLLLLFVLVFLIGCSPAAPTQIAEAPARRPQPTAVQRIQPRPQPTQPTYPTDNTFKDYGSNPQEDTTWDNLSTFGLDVDTAAYTVGRRYINDGLLPPPESVRIEEYVNFFKQDYPMPADSVFAIYADGAPSPFSFSDEIVVRFGIQGYRPYERKPLSLTFVIDISGSMNRENRLGLVKRSLELLLDQLYPGDTVAIVTFGSDARVHLQPTDVRSSQKIRSAIRSMRIEGSTNAEAGLKLGFRMARRNFRRDAVNRVILCSDGVANMGKITAEEILKELRSDSKGEIPLSTFGFGMGNFNDVLMEQLANQGDGMYAYIDTIEEAERLFVAELVDAFEVIARNARIQVDFNPAQVESYRLLGYENREIADEDFRNDEVDAGELGAGHSATALYLVRLHPGAEGRLATFQMRWEDPNTRQVQEINGNFNAWNVAASYSDASPRLQLDVLAAYYAGQLRYDEWAMDAGWYDLAQHARRVAKILRSDPDVVEFSRLVERASQLTEW